MKKRFSKKWKASKQPRKQRKYLANAPFHIKRKFLSVNLSRELRKKYNIRNIVARKGDTVKILRGKFKGKTGKIEKIRVKLMKIYVEGIKKTKLDGSKANVPLRASNLQIIELNTEDPRRMKRLDKKKNEEGKVSPKNKGQKESKKTQGDDSEKLNKDKKSDK